MTIVPFELKHINMLDMSKTNGVSVNIPNINKKYIIYGKTAFDDDRVIGIGLVSLIGRIAIASLIITDKVRNSPLSLIKAVKRFLLEVDNEGYIIIATAYTEAENKFMIYLGFKEEVKFKNNGYQLTRYRYVLLPSIH